MCNSNIQDDFFKLKKLGFLTHNYYDSFLSLENNLKNDKYLLEKIDNNFIVRAKYPNKLVYFFINEIKDLNLSSCSYARIMKDDENMLLFLNKNNFSLFKEYKNMSLNLKSIDAKIKDEIKSVDTTCIDIAKSSDIDSLYAFFLKHFNKDYEFFYSPEDLKEKLDNILVLKKDNVIKGALIFKESLLSVLLDYIAVDANSDKGSSYILLCALLQKYIDKSTITLFVDKENEHAYNFYKRSYFKDIENRYLRIFKN